MGALLYLLTRQWKGAALNMLRSGLRTLMGMFAFAVVFGQIFQSFYLFAALQSHSASRLPLIPEPILRGILLFILAAPAYAILLEGLQGNLIAFSPADVDFLFAMPLSQKTVLAMRLGLQWLQYLWWIALGVVWASPLLAHALAAPLGAVAWRAVVGASADILFALAASHALYIFYAYRVRSSEWLLAVVKWGGLALAILLLYILSRDAAVVASPWQQAARMFNHPIIRTLLLPVSLCVDLILSAQPQSVAMTVPRLLALGGLTLAAVAAVFVQRENVYEPSLAASLRRARWRNALKSGGISALRTERLRERDGANQAAGYAVADFGVGWITLVWKATQLAVRAPWRNLGIGAFLSLGPPLFLYFYRPPGLEGLIAYLTSIIGGYGLWISGVLVMGMVRNELTQGAFLKQLPMPAWQIIVGLLLPPVALFTLLAWLSLAAFALLFPEMYQPLLAPLAVVGPTMMGAVSLYHAFIAILFPRKKDPMNQLLSGMLLFPGWGLLLIAPMVTWGILVGGWARSVKATPPELSRMLWWSGLGVGVGYLLLWPLLVWLAAAVFRAYSPADD